MAYSVIIMVALWASRRRGEEKSEVKNEEERYNYGVERLVGIKIITLLSKKPHWLQPTHHHFPITFM